ncbi:hypothetical protein [Dactylosporangium fulvum]|uniref:Uncharacterized protein n=1 Tax=Dactylosporangium fulvum TaxID=53359 RepID=A0ABY5VT50_9ACTN|nr:hypothetical protein [Dactylosporangium fulvum]UWP80927.1 hypothetical protein Dfulv_38235 [Dactylosporangium fulvum]
MSISLLLIPLAVAAVSARAAAVSADSRTVCRVQTRMRDTSLLAEALRACAAEVSRDGDDLVADWAGVRTRFGRDAEGIWTAHFTGDVDEARAVEIVRAVDAAYGRQVQQAVLARLQERAPAAGLRLESRTVTPDAAVRLVFAVEQV